LAEETKGSIAQPVETEDESDESDFDGILQVHG
jgi:hypothetical protein